MTKRYLFALIILALAGEPSLLPQSQSPSDSVYGTQNDRDPSGTCPDGSTTLTLADGSKGCQPAQRLQSPTGEDIGARPNSVSSPTENDRIEGTQRNRSTIPPLDLAPEPLTEFQKFVAATTGQLLPLYGASLFRNVPSTFAPNDLSPVTSDYTIGPDDELRIRMWGQVNYSGNLRVNRSGDIYFPEVGSVHVAGLQYSALDQHLRSAVGKVYRNFDLSVDMGRIRSMQIYLTGQARHPGAYTVSSLSSLVDALFACGGPSAQGSLRHIELRRAGKVINDFDLYALLIHGDKSNDARLSPEDVLFIPAVGPQVAVTGSINSPGIYELRGTETIGDLIDAAGKTTAVASSTRISLERLGDHQVRQAMEFPMDANGLAATLADGDILRVFSIVPAYQKTVTLRGDVANPGRFAWRAGMHISDLIPDRDSLLSRDYWWRRSRLGLPSPEFEPLISNLKPTQRQQVGSSSLYSENQNGDNPHSNSPYRRNGTDQYQINNDQYNQNLRAAAGKDATGAGLAESELEHSSSSNDSSTGSGQEGNGSTIASHLDQRDAQGTEQQSRRTDVKISAPEIDWNYAVIERLDPDTLKTSLIPFDLGKLVLKHDPAQDIAIEPGDTVTIFSQTDIRVPLDEQTKYVRLEGEFVHSGIYSVRPGETLRDVVIRAGGLTNNAYLYGSEFDRESSRILQQQRIDEYVRRVDLDADRGTLALTASSTSNPANAASAASATAAEQQLVARLKQIRASGRIVLKFEFNSAGVADVPAISLENGDRLIVPPVPATVNVVGAVYNQNSFLYQRGGTAGSYIQMAGGSDRDADSRRTFVIRADGSVVSHNAVKTPWGNSFAALKLYPGDSIVVPDKTLRPTALRGLLDWTQIFSQLALGAAAVQILR
jgi:protein involved in polysaccharide export with SLBB domain